MSIHVPGSRLLHHLPLEVVRERYIHGGRKAVGAALNLVAYIDMMTMLVIFLIMNFSATGEIVFVQKNLVLPEASNWTQLERAPVIAINPNVVTYEGQQIATIEELQALEEGADPKVPELFDKLEAYKTEYMLRHPEGEFNGVLILQSDKGVEFKVLKRLMYTAGLAGYPKLSFAVAQKANKHAGGH